MGALRACMRAALKSCKKRDRRIFVEVFSGHGNLSRALRRRGVGVIAWDWQHGEHFNLLHDDVFRTLKGWLRSCAIWGIWFGTPCESFTQARRAPPGSRMPCRLRSAEHVRGLPDLLPKDHEAVRRGNLLADRVAALQSLAADLKVLGGEENPGSSWLWKLRSRATFAERPQVSDSILDYCAFGTPYRARTRIRLWQVRPQTALAKCKCSGRGICTFSGKPHEQLTGASKAGFATRKKNCLSVRLMLPSRHCLCGRA